MFYFTEINVFSVNITLHYIEVIYSAQPAAKPLNGV